MLLYTGDGSVIAYLRLYSIRYSILPPYRHIAVFVHQGREGQYFKLRKAFVGPLVINKHDAARYHDKPAQRIAKRRAFPILLNKYRLLAFGLLRAAVIAGNGAKRRLNEAPKPRTIRAHLPYPAI